jgi:hypothetical protein
MQISDPKTNKSFLEGLNLKKQFFSNFVRLMGKFYGQKSKRSMTQLLLRKGQHWPSIKKKFIKEKRKLAHQEQTIATPNNYPLQEYWACGSIRNKGKVSQ